MPFRTLITTVLLLLAPPLHAQTPDTTAINQLFAGYASDSTPGCAIGIARGAELLFAHGYGMADLERHVAITPATVLEAGSVSKQVTAAAVLLLAARGFLSLDDNILRFFPELPDFGTPITIRHLMQHTSGLRDWGAIAELEGWPRGTRTVSQSDVLTILSRQRGLNHAVGAKFSYTNSGYNLLVMLVERVTGQSFPAFTARDLFVPLGMTHTQWRDDYARIIPDRAQAYSRRGASWVLDMPFENAYGNGGLLTTVGDLLRWTEAIARQRIGSPDVSAEMQAPGMLADGKPIGYGGGLFLQSYLGVREVGHSGATAGYRTFLGRYPESGYQVAVLCNAGNADAVSLAHNAMQPLVGFSPPQVTHGDSVVGANRYVPSAATLAHLAGTWVSNEAAARWALSIHGDTLRVQRRPGDTFDLHANGRDHFHEWGNGPVEVRFVRNTKGGLTAMLVTIPRAVGVKFFPERVRR